MLLRGVSLALGFAWLMAALPANADAAMNGASIQAPMFANVIR
jgi:hypothetical protein